MGTRAGHLNRNRLESPNAQRLQNRAGRSQARPRTEYFTSSASSQRQAPAAPSASCVHSVFNREIIRHVMIALTTLSASTIRRVDPLPAA